MSSTLLDGILERQNRATNLKVVFVDVASYSKRRSQSQAAVIDAFMHCLENARKNTAKEFTDFCEQNKVNFADDVIFLPSGDGAAICFPFEGIHDVHLVFAKNLLEQVANHNKEQACDKSNEQGWCNCHSAFDLSIGISEGKGVLYRDVNKNYNVAGNVINLAARVMGIAGKNQIFFSEEGYRQIIDMVDDPHLDEKFTEFKNVRIKHNLRISVYQLTDDSLEYINSDVPKDLQDKLEMDAAMGSLGKLGFPNPADSDGEIDRKKFAAATGMLVDAMTNLTKSATVIDASDSKTDNTPD